MLGASAPERRVGTDGFGVALAGRRTPYLSIFATYISRRSEASRRNPYVKLVRSFFKLRH
eukprot:1194810-Prorocentrum_minimum.AAC.5